MKTAKRTLAVLLSLLMAFGMFSIVGSAVSEFNPSDTKPELWEGAGTITYGLDVYKVDGETFTKVESGCLSFPKL